MDDTCRQMNHELFFLSAYRVLILSRRILLAAFSIFFTYGLFYHVYSRPIIYLSLASLLLPLAVSVLWSGISDRLKPPAALQATNPLQSSARTVASNPKPPLFPSLWKRYSYAPEKLRDLSIGMLLESGLLLLWQFTSAVSFPSSFFSWLPCILAIFLIACMLIGIPAFYALLQRKMMYGKVL